VCICSIVKKVNIRARSLQVALQDVILSSFEMVVICRVESSVPDKAWQDLSPGIINSATSVTHYSLIFCILNKVTYFCSSNGRECMCIYSMYVNMLLC
jgi:hypothetical protein